MAISAYNRKIAIALAFSGAIAPFPTAWLHKFYLGHYLWGIVYLVLAPTQLPRVACLLEGAWYLTQSDDGFANRFPQAGSILRPVSSEGPLQNTTEMKRIDITNIDITNQVAKAIRELELLRQEGLITEYEFEQKRRKLLEQV
ncbi:MAG: putative membrane protein [Phormidesmis priestleyi Ana]|uniref:Putative membrane protein n=1 Tax=Phormidesmis priestleyi Ana TaxID=1666911 RepID=A0A0P7Z1R0_9CYAN|nr:MAG: putative membrane protein [Phormidesmis priestleyi Ana]